MRGKDARGDHGQYQVTLATRASADEMGKIQPLHGYTHGRHMAMRPGGDHFELLCRRRQAFTAQDGANRLDLRIGQRRKIGQRAFADPASFAEGFT